MRLVFDRRKAAQAAAYIVHLHGGQINLMALIKLLYLADRAALLKTGYTITGDTMVSMPHGPVLSRIYDAAKWGDCDGDPWYEYLSEIDGHRVSLTVAEPATNKLSDYETHTLRAIHEKFGQLSQWQLRDLTHKLPEWKDPHGSSTPIETADVLKSGGKSDAEIERLTRAAEERYFLASLQDEAS